MGSTDLLSVPQGAPSEEPKLPLPLPESLPIQLKGGAEVKDLDEIFTASSDPPLFSSDDLPASSAENYTKPRRKTQHKRAWYDDDEEQGGKRLRLDHSRNSRARAPIARNFDSGIGICDDEEVDLSSSDAEAKEEALRRALSSKHLEDPGYFYGPVWPYWQSQPENIIGYHNLQSQAHNRVRQAIEADTHKITVDLSSGRFEDIRTPTLRQLRYTVKELNFPLEYDELDPLLEIYLSNNRLREVPSELCHLNGLRVLSLRGNQIIDIPPALGSLPKLEELNLGSNKLQYMPYEILNLLCRNLTGISTLEERPPRFNFFPNPFVRPWPSTWTPRKAGKGWGQGVPWSLSGRGRMTDPYFVQIPKLTYAASTRPAFLDIIGRPRPQYPPAPTSQHAHWPSNDFDSPLHPPASQQTRTPSLLELSLRTLQASPNCCQAPFLLPNDATPHIVDLVKRTFKLQQNGGQKCTICQTLFIVPRTEWIEWWTFQNFTNMQDFHSNYAHSNTNTASLMPFLRHGCSWACWEERENAFFTGWRSSTANEDEDLPTIKGGPEGKFTHMSLKAQIKRWDSVRQGPLMAESLEQNPDPPTLQPL